MRRVHLEVHVDWRAWSIGLYLGPTVWDVYLGPVCVQAWWEVEG